MRITTVTIARTVQVRQYEPLAVSATAEIGPQDAPEDAAAALLAYIKDALWEATGHMRAEFAPAPAQLDFGL